MLLKVVEKHSDRPVAFEVEASTKEELLKKVSKAIGVCTFIDDYGTDIFSYLEKNSWDGREVVAWHREDDEGIPFWITKSKGFKTY